MMFSSAKFAQTAGMAICLMNLLSGCTEPTGPRTVYNPNPAVKIPSIKDAVSDRDLSAAPELIKSLDSDDPAVRFYAIEGLRRLTGEDFGYRFYQEKDQRRPAIARWRKWMQKSDSR
jgi:hypothetical protein